MIAIAVSHDDRVPRIVERSRPEPGPGEALVRTLRVGIDGTDHEVIAGGHGDFPPGSDELVLGHEAVGIVEDPNDTSLERGATVVPTVRRPPPDVDTTPFFERGEADMAPAGSYVERGIVGADGFMAEYFTSPAAYLVEIPPGLAAHGVLIEPLSNDEKAIELASATRQSFHWAPESAFVLGNGPLGLLALARCAVDDRFERLYCLGRRDRPDPTIDIIERLGSTYIDSRETPLTAVRTSHESMDLVIEATGHARHAFESLEVLGSAGVAALLGIPPAGTIEIKGGALHRDVVLENKALVGSVNSNVRHFEAAREHLADMPGWFPDAVLTDVFSPNEAEQAFDADGTGVKTAIEFAPPDQAEH